MADEEQKLIEVDSDKLVPIKAMPSEARELANKRLLDRINRLEAKRRQQIRAEEQRKTEPKTKTRQGVVVCGKLSEEEQRALASNDPSAIRNIARLRQMALRMSRLTRWGNKVSTLEALKRLHK